MLYYSSFILRVIALLAAITACILYVLSAGKTEMKEQEIKRLQAELQVLADENESINAKYSILEDKMAQESQLAEESQTQVEEATAETIALEQEKQRLQNKVTEAEREVARLKETTTRLREELINAEENYAAASQEGLIAQLNERIEELTASNTQLKGKIDTLYRSEEIADITLSGTESTADSLNQFSLKKLTPAEVNSITESTRIASISTENGIIVLDAASSSNLQPNTTIQLVKDFEVVAQVRIININGSLAIANILPGASLNGLRKGTTVKILR